MDFFPPNAILKLFCIVKTLTCFPAVDTCVLLTIAVVGVIPAVFVIAAVGFTPLGEVLIVVGCGMTGVLARVETVFTGEGQMGKP